MKAGQKRYLPQAGSGTDTGAGESRPLPVSADRGCPSYSGGGKVLLDTNKPFARSGLLKRTPPKATTSAWTRTETEQTETEDGISTGDEGVQSRRATSNPLTFFSPMASTPKNRGEWKRKKSPTTKENETLAHKEDRLLNGLFDNIIAENSLVDRQGPYKNTANEVKIRLRELQKLCGRVLDVRRMRAENDDEYYSERTPKRSKRVAEIEDKGTNTSTGGELEWEVSSPNRQRGKKNKKTDEMKENPERIFQEKKENMEIDISGKTVLGTVNTLISKRKGKRNTESRKSVGRKQTRKKYTARPEALLVEVKDRDYASVLKEVKLGLASEEIVLSKVRKTKRGDILLELESGQNEGALQIKEKVAKIYPSLSLRTLKETADVIIKGLDITVEIEEVEECLRHKVKEFRIKSFWANRYGVKTAIIELPKEEAEKLVEEKKIKIGWMRVPVGHSEQKKRCYRCLEYGHIATGCQGQDRSRKCFNCGNEGHKAKECDSETLCAICKEKGHRRTNHRIGSRSCPSWKENVPATRNRNQKNGV